MTGRIPQRRLSLLLVLTICLSLTFCSKESQKPAGLSDPARTFSLRGKIIARDQNGITIDHEPIEGFMEAMTMQFPVKDTDLTKIPPDGASITAKLHVTDTSFWITDVKTAK